MKKNLLGFLVLSSLSGAGLAAGGPPDGWSGMFLNATAFQKSSADMLRSRPSPFRPDLVTDHGGRFQNSFALQYKTGDWTFMGFYTDNRTIGGNSAYSLTNPMSFGVNYVETTGTYREAVDYKSGLHELAATYRKGGTMVMVGKIDTSNWYLYDRMFSGDLSNGMDYGNAATRVVAPPFPSMAMVVKQDFGKGWSLTGIVGDAFGDRETINAARNLVHGDLAYVAELNYEDAKQHYQLTLNHVDAFRYYDKDAEYPVPGQKAPKVDAVMATARYNVNSNWSVFGRVSYADGKAQQEDLNYLAGVRYDQGKFYALLSQSATRVGAVTKSPNKADLSQAATGDYTLVSELTLNYKVHPKVTVGLTYDFLNSTGKTLRPAGLSSFIMFPV